RPRSRRYRRQRRRDRGVDGARGLPQPAPGHRQLSHAAQPAGVPPRHARDDHRPAPGLPRGLHAQHLVGLAGHIDADRQRVSQIHALRGPLLAGRRGAKIRMTSAARHLGLLLRSTLFNVLFFGWTALELIVILPLLLLPPPRAALWIARNW